MEKFIQAFRSEIRKDIENVRATEISPGVLKITFINLPKGYGGEGGGAEAQNNLGMYAVKKLPDGRFKLEVWRHEFPREVAFAGRTGKMDSIAKYLAKGINKIWDEVPFQFTHSKPLDFLQS